MANICASMILWLGMVVETPRRAVGGLVLFGGGTFLKIFHGWVPESWEVDGRSCSFLNSKWGDLWVPVVNLAGCIEVTLRGMENISTPNGKFGKSSTQKYGWDMLKIPGEYMNLQSYTDLPNV